ncbi:hypothetical protein FXO38_15014 [Capsicum annuum]|nr:hypothetical protein FXO38_15014 [Capsicum annuum]
MDGCFLEIEFLSLCVRLPPRHLCQRLRLYGMVFIVDDPIRLNAFFFALNQQTFSIAAPVREFGSQVPTTTQFLLVKPVDEHIRRFEIDLHGLETFPGVKRISIKPQTYRWVFPDTNNGIVVLAEGHLMNLGCATGHPSFGGDAASRPVSPMDARKSHDDNDPNDIL